MSYFFMPLVAAVFVMTAVYAHGRIRRYTEGSAKVALTRIVLVVTGIGFGLVSAASYAGEPLNALLACLIGFGAVHVPAAIILFVKQQRGSART
jgi:hypothetical protein